MVVLDVRSAIDGGGAEAYAKAHIPGAMHSDYDKAGWRVTRNGVPFMLPTAAELEKLIGELGIDEDSHVVVVPAGVSATDFGAAARIYWTLKVAGHPAVSILDGGFAAWQAAAYPVESGKQHAVAEDLHGRSSTSACSPKLEAGRAQRATRRWSMRGRRAIFDGKEKAPAAKAYGHIPGAINLDSASSTIRRPTGCGRRTQLAAIAARLPAGPVVTYCNTGHWAATDWFVLSAMLGRPGRAALRRLDGRMDRRSRSRPVASSRTRGTI